MGIWDVNHQSKWLEYAKRLVSVLVKLYIIESSDLIGQEQMSTTEKSERKPA